MGHAGTLDPFATGLLVVLVGAATRLQRYLLELPKTYRATARLGWCSSTGDPDGELVETGRLPGRLELPVGRVRQRLPMTSAVRVDGERLYHRAHRGETVVTPEREIEVHATRLLGTSGLAPDPAAGGARAEFEIVCSSGTYVRTLIETLGDAYCDELRRTAIGTMRVPGAGGSRWIEPADALAHLPARRLSPAEREAAAHGRPLPFLPGTPAAFATPAPAANPGPATPAPPAAAAAPSAAGAAAAESALRVRLLAEGELVAVARLEGGALRPEVVLV